MLKRIVIILCVVGLVSCGSKTTTPQEDVWDMLRLLEETTQEQDAKFSDYENLFASILDSLQYKVLNSPDADERYNARAVAHNMLPSVCIANGEEQTKVICSKYNEQNELIKHSWYVQLLTDSTDNSHFILMSFAKPYDEHGNITRMGLSFIENNVQDPLLIINIPKNILDNNPLVLFSKWDENNEEHSSCAYCRANQNVEIIGEPGEDGHCVMLSGKFLDDMLSYDVMYFCYLDGDLVTNPGKEKITKGDGVGMISIELSYFQKQHLDASKWLQ